VQSPPTSLPIFVRLLGCFFLLAATACPGGSSTDAKDAGASNGSAGTSGGGGGYFAGDPCALLTDADFAKLSMPMTIGSTDPHNVGSKTFSPECHFSLQGNGSSATVAVYVDKVGDFDLQKLVFHGVALSGLGKNAWQGDAAGKGNSTIGVLLDKWSFRVDSTYEYKYDDLKILASAVAARLK
jgi:hypothetical protein